jgi:hypothetical protein
MSVMAFVPMLPVGLLWIYRRRRRAVGGRG